MENITNNTAATDMGRLSLLHSSLFFTHTLLIFLMPALILSCTHTVPGDAEPPERHTDIPILFRAQDRSEGLVADIFIYDDDRQGRLDTYQRCLIGEDGKVIAASRVGNKILAAIANPQTDEYEWDKISSFEALAGICADMRLDDMDSPLMSGITRFSAGPDNCPEQILEIVPMMSEICLRSLRCDFGSTPYDGATMDNVYVYLANVNTLAEVFRTEGFLPEAPVNIQGTPEGAMSGIPEHEMLCRQLEGPVGNAAVQPDLRLRCYPNESKEDNAGSPFTRLIISGEIMGRRYYYPININRGEFGALAGNGGVGRNCRYIFDIVLKRTGATSPDDTVLPGTVESVCNVVPWTEKDETEIIF